MSQLYDFIDQRDFLKKKQKNNALMITEFDQLCKERDQFYIKLFFRAYCIANGNISAMARGLKYGRTALVNYLIATYGVNYKEVLDNFVKNSKLEIE